MRLDAEFPDPIWKKQCPEQAVGPRVKLMRGLRDARVQSGARTTRLAVGLSMTMSRSRALPCGVLRLHITGRNECRQCQNTFQIHALTETLRTIRGFETKWLQLRLWLQPAHSTKRI
jgi:hypothetical protein